MFWTSAPNTVDAVDLEENLSSRKLCGRGVVAAAFALGAALVFTPVALADPSDPSVPGPVQVDMVPMGDNVTPAAVAACAAFAEALDGTSIYYGDFADSFEGSTYADPAVGSSNAVGRTALRQGAGVALEAANTPGLQPEIASPMRSWSMSATAMLVKMGLRIPGDSLNNTANDMNNKANEVQVACAAAGTHA